MSIIHQHPGLLVPMGMVPPFEQGLIRIQDIAPAFYNNLADGDGEQDIPQPPGIQINDDLFVLTLGSGLTSSPVNIGDWTNRLSVLGGAGELWWRKASGGGAAADQFTFAAHTLVVQVAFMVRIRHMTDATDTPSLFQGGFLNTDFDNGWEVGFPPGTSLALNTTNDPDAFVFLIEFRRAGINGVSAVAVNDADPDNMELIASIAVNDGSDVSPSADTMWLQWKFKYTNPGIAYTEYDEGYDVDPTLGGQWTQHQRWAYFP